MRSSRSWRTAHSPGGDSTITLRRNDDIASDIVFVLCPRLSFGEQSRKEKVSGGIVNVLSSVASLIQMDVCIT